MGFSDWFAALTGSTSPPETTVVDILSTEFSWALNLNRVTEQRPSNPADVEKLCTILRSPGMDLQKGFELLRNKFRSGDPDTVLSCLEILDNSVKLCGKPVQTAFLTKSCMDELSTVLETYGPMQVPPERLPFTSAAVRKRTLEILICWNHASPTDRQFDFAKNLVLELGEKGYQFPWKKDPRTLLQFIRQESCRCGLILDALSKQCGNCNQLFCSACSPGIFGFSDLTGAAKDPKSSDGIKNASEVVCGRNALPEANPEARRVENDVVLAPEQTNDVIQLTDGFLQVQTRMPQALRETVAMVSKKDEASSGTGRTEVHIPIPDGDDKPIVSARSLFGPKPGPPANQPVHLAAGPRSKPDPFIASIVTPKVGPVTLVTRPNAPLQKRYGKLELKEQPGVTPSAVPKIGGPVAVINVKKVPPPIVRPSRASLLKQAHTEVLQKPQSFPKVNIAPASKRNIQTNTNSVQPGTFPQQVPSSALSHCDVILRSRDGKLVYAQSAVLRARAPVFATAFKALDLATLSGQECFEVNDMERATLSVFVQCLSGRDGLQIGPVAEDLLAVADKYGQEELKIRCVEELQKDLTSDTAGRTLLLASRYGLQNLKNCALLVITDGLKQRLRTGNVRNFDDVLLDLADVVLVDSESRD